jgi:microcystin-dependent protein
MGQPYVGEIRQFGGNFAPVGWLPCDGRVLPISENETLFQLIGTTYGGDGQSTFGLPNLCGRVPIHQGTGNDGTTFTIGELGGVESVTLTTNQIPVHTHTMVGSTDPSTSNNVQGAVGASLPAAGTQSAYGTDPPIVNINAAAIGPAGGSQPHDNMAPYLAVTVIISLFGIFPSPT